MIECWHLWDISNKYKSTRDLRCRVTLKNPGCATFCLGKACTPRPNPLFCPSPTTSHISGTYHEGIKFTSSSVNEAKQKVAPRKRVGCRDPSFDLPGSASNDRFSSHLHAPSQRLNIQSPRERSICFAGVRHMPTLGFSSEWREKELVFLGFLRKRR